MKRILCSVLAIAALSVLGCQSDQLANPDHAKAHASMCPKCETVWVATPSTAGQKSISYSRDAKMKCPDCESSVSNYLATGKLEHACKSCGVDAVKHCSVHKSMASDTAVAGKGDAIMCDACQTTWVRSPVTTATAGSRSTSFITVYAPTGKGPCADCEKMVVECHKTGKMDMSACKACGGTMKKLN